MAENFLTGLQNGLWSMDLLCLFQHIGHPWSRQSVKLLDKSLCRSNRVRVTNFLL